MKTARIDPIKTLIAILIVPVSLFVGGRIDPYIQGTLNKIILAIVIALVNFFIALYLYGDVLKSEWPLFKKHFWRNLLIAVVCMIACYFVLGITRSLLQTMHMLPKASAMGASQLLLSSQLTSATYGLIGSIPALLAPFTEEIIFRHVLFFQFNKNKFFMFIMFFVSSIAFGLAHWNNFNGQIIAMIPYMAVGAWFALIYFVSKNIWQNIVTHFLFDFVQVAAGILVFVVALLTK